MGGPHKPMQGHLNIHATRLKEQPPRSRLTSGRGLAEALMGTGEHGWVVTVCGWGKCSAPCFPFSPGTPPWCRWTQTSQVSQFFIPQLMHPPRSIPLHPTVQRVRAWGPLQGLRGSDTTSVRRYLGHPSSRWAFWVALHCLVLKHLGQRIRLPPMSGVMLNLFLIAVGLGRAKLGPESPLQQAELCFAVPPAHLVSLVPPNRSAPDDPSSVDLGGRLALRRPQP